MKWVSNNVFIFNKKRCILIPISFLGNKFVCCHCNRSFAYSNNLSEHRQVYHEGKRVHCPICSKSFTRRNSVRQHMAKFHQEHNAHTQVQKTDSVLIPNSIGVIVNTNGIYYQQQHQQKHQHPSTSNTSKMDFFCQPTNPYGFPSLVDLIEYFFMNKLNWKNKKSFFILIYVLCIHR